jgi:hypothetical protein
MPKSTKWPFFLNVFGLKYCSWLSHACLLPACVLSSIGCKYYNARLWATFRHVHIIGKAPISFVMSIRLSACIGTAHSGRIFVEFDIGNFYANLSKDMYMSFLWGIFRMTLLTVPSSWRHTTLTAHSPYRVRDVTHWTKNKSYQVWRMCIVLQVWPISTLMPLESKRRQNTINNTDWNVGCYCNSKLPKTYTWWGTFTLKDGMYAFTFFLKSINSVGYFTWRPNYVLLLPAT